MDWFFQLSRKRHYALVICLENNYATGQGPAAMLPRELAHKLILMTMGLSKPYGWNKEFEELLRPNIRTFVRPHFYPSNGFAHAYIFNVDSSIFTLFRDYQWNVDLRQLKNNKIQIVFEQNYDKKCKGSLRIHLETIMISVYLSDFNKMTNFRQIFCGKIWHRDVEVNNVIEIVRQDVAKIVSQSINISSLYDEWYIMDRLLPMIRYAAMTMHFKSAAIQ